MQSKNIALIVVVALAAIALVIFLIRKNRRDRKELFNPEATDPVAGEKKEQQENREEL